MWPLLKKKTPSTEDLYLAMKSAWVKLSKYYAAAIPTMGMLLISAHILDPLRIERLFMKWDTGMDINAEDETSHIIQYQDA